MPETDNRLRGPRVIVSRGAMHRVTPARLAAERCRFPALAAMPRPILAVLLGGSNKSYRLTPRRLGEIADAIAALLRHRGGSAWAPSRRTGKDGLKLLQERLAGLPAAIWDGTGDNPYFAYLGLADAFIVTADLLSTISEAAATGKPVHILELDGGGEIRPLSPSDAAGRDHPAVFRQDRNLVLSDPRCHRAGGCGIARTGFAPVRPAPRYIELNSANFVIAVAFGTLGCRGAGLRLNRTFAVEMSTE